ncbi:MAG: TetR/AcrR family transcriptional regulator C-terminal domain-containing protein [Candidatus Limnocylindria bacterium]
MSRERVLRAAIELADEAGIEALTMRRLAQQLGVEAMTLYYHVANKNDILAGIVDLVVEEIALPTAGGDWKAELRASSISAHDVLVRHPWSASLVLSGPGLSQARMRQMDAILGTLRSGGFSADMTDHAYHALDSHIMGFTLWQVGMDLGDDEEDLAALAASVLESLAPNALPHLVEHIHQHLRPSDPEDEGEGEFAFGLDLLLDGLERIRGYGS